MHSIDATDGLAWSRCGLLLQTAWRGVVFMCAAEVWAGRDEAGNYSQKHDAEIIKEEKRIEVENEVRLQVDELMREELKNLKMVRSSRFPQQRYRLRLIAATRVLKSSVCELKLN